MLEIYRLIEAARSELWTAAQKRMLIIWSIAVLAFCGVAYWKSLSFSAIGIVYVCTIVAWHASYVNLAESLWKQLHDGTRTSS